MGRYKRKTESEKKAEKEKQEAYYRAVVYKGAVKRAEQLNKLMNSRNTKDVKCTAPGAYTVKFKDGQVFKFNFLPDSVFGEKTIIVKEVV